MIRRCTPEQALLKIEPDHVKQVLHPTFSAEVLESKDYKENVVAVGLAGGPGAAIGKLAFTTEDAEARQGEGVILVRENTSPEVRLRFFDVCCLKRVRNLIVATTGRHFLVQDVGG
jgi:phosphoenolpyruvate synthase/pyruvate phosphate dikinase